MTDSVIFTRVSQKVQFKRAQIGKFEPELTDTSHYGPRWEKNLFRLPNGGLYQGQWLRNTDIRQGWGVQVGPGGTEMYEGYFMYNQMHGKGRFISENGKVVEGEWIAGKMHGKTTIRYPNADLFMGTIVNNEMQGTGK